MILRKLSRATLEQKPYEAWNAFINLLAKEKYEDLDEVQRIAHLCFWYDSEVQNGGHLQYFENRGTVFLDETLASLAVLGAECQRRILGAAGRLISITPNASIDTIDDYVAASREAQFASSDSAYLAANHLFKSC